MNVKSFFNRNLPDHVDTIALTASVDKRPRSFNPRGAL